MKTFLRVLALSGLFVLFVLPLIAQGPTVDTTGASGWNPFDKPVTIDDMTQAYNAIFGALVVLWGYIARLIGWKTEKVPFVFVVAAGAAVVAGVFITVGWAQAAPLVITFFLSLGIFDTFLKPGEKAIKGRVSR